MKLMKQLTHPTRFCDAICNDTVFCVRTRAGPRGLSARRPRNQIITKEDTKTGCSNPPNQLSNKINRGALMELQAKVSGATDIKQYAFNELKVRVTWCMHE
jgi:hypothetical protein